MESAIDQRKKEFEQAGLTFQPMPVFVGPLTVIESAFVVVNDVLYQVESALQAVSLCFQCYFALEAAYPERAQPLWKFVQISCFDIKLNNDVCNRSVNALTGYVERHLADNEPL